MERVTRCEAPLGPCHIFADKDMEWNIQVHNLLCWFTWQ